MYDIMKTVCCYDRSEPIKTQADYYQRSAEEVLLRTAGSCEGKDKNMRRGSDAAGREAGREESWRRWKMRKRRRDRGAQGISILIDLWL